MLNANNYGYCKIGFDEKSIEYFRDNTQNIESVVNRNLIYRYLWQHYKSNKMPFSNYFTMVKNCINTESSMNAVVQMLNSCQIYSNKYVKAGDEHKKFTEEAFDMVIGLFRSKSDPQDQNQVASYALSFIPDTNLALKYLQKDSVLDKDGEVVHESYHLTKSQKHQLLPMVYSSDDVDSVAKESIKQVSLFVRSP